MKKKYFIFTILIAIAFIFISTDLKYFSKFLMDFYSFILYRPRMNLVMFILFIGAGVLTILPYTQMKKMINKMIVVHLNPLLVYVKKNFGKIIITTTFTVLFIIYTKQQTKIDATGIIIVILSFTPWVYHLITTLKLPGGFEIALKDLPQAQRLVQGISRTEGNNRTEGNVRMKGNNPAEENRHMEGSYERENYNFQNYIDSNPNIAVVSLRIEIENRLRMISRTLGYSEYEPIGRISKNLCDNGIITENEFYGMNELIHVGNKAAQGNRVDSDVAKWVKDNALSVLRILDDKIKAIN